MRNGYAQRRLSDGCPGLDQLALNKYVSIVDGRRDDAPRVDRLMKYFGRLIDLSNRRDLVVIGCGPKPHPMAVLIRRGYNVIGVEPMPSFVASATAFLGAPGTVVEGSAESMPLPSESCDIALLETVLEHVDSPTKSLEEVFRVLRPGGIAFLTTTNRFRISPTGWNGEFNVPFYNWLPSIVKESFVFYHLHYNPELANFTERPAVHWFSYADLCALGRQVGFGQFYSLLDLQDNTDESVTGGRGPLKTMARGVALTAVQSSPWLRALALTTTQWGGDIIMFKRSSAGTASRAAQEMRTPVYRTDSKGHG